MEIIFYTNENCGYCQQQKEWFIKNNIKFQEKDISNNEKYFKEFRELNAIGTPLTIIKHNNREDKLLGFNERKLKKLVEVIHEDL
jgi:glutaredoxin-like protein NrdH